MFAEAELAERESGPGLGNLELERDPAGRKRA
jgi:hypothetical protein